MSGAVEEHTRDQDVVSPRSALLPPAATSVTETPSDHRQQHEHEHEQQVSHNGHGHEHPADSTAAAAAAAAARKRVRTGCLNCRRKHKKCDEQKPVCQGCISKNEVCEWPVPKLRRASKRKQSVQYPAITGPFHSQLPHRTSSSTTSSSLASQTTNQIPVYSFTAQPIYTDTGKRESSDLFSYSLNSGARPTVVSASSSSPSTVRDAFANIIADDTQACHHTVRPVPPSDRDNMDWRGNLYSDKERSLLTEMANSLERYLITQTAVQERIPPLLVANEDKMCLMECYLAKIAPALDVDSPVPLFLEELPLIMKDQPALSYAAMAFASLAVNSKVSGFELFRNSLHNLFGSSPIPSQVRDATLLLLILFLHHYGLHESIVPHVRSTTPTISFHFALLRLTLASPNLVLSPPTTTLPHTLLPLLMSSAQQDFLQSFTIATALNSSLSPVLEYDASPFPVLLVPSSRSLHTYLLLNTAMVLLLSRKPLDVKVRSRPVAYYAKRVCGLVGNNISRCPWYSSWCLYQVGRVLTHESEHARVKDLIKILDGEQSQWGKKLEDYWEGRGDV